ncbi:hypothetical protein [Jidongwangia harbinensis]|uniref:hypothetical protein n=1 Tax=Jidongwangia harbinensis TaxID=2878561 RepID=UPI001CD93EB1|nr:hypothetical protein [Jidongwangia harbinensis]MCA2213332.1 hypothetical protein [Jidongwangia harbinensis]
MSAALGAVILLPGTALADGPLADQAVLNAVQASPEFQQVQAENSDLELVPSLSRTAREGHFAVAVQALKDDFGTTLVATHFVDMNTGDVKLSRLGRIVVEDAGATARGRFGENVSKTARITMTTNGAVDFVGTVSDTGVLREDTGYEAVANEARQKAKAGCVECDAATKPVDPSQELSAMGWCEDLINILCGASGAFQCFLYCSAFGTTPAGLGCGVICGLIATLGCASVINQLC